MGTENFYPRLFFCFTGAATCVIIYLFARDIFNKRVALLAGIIAIVYPGLFIYGGWLYTESLFTFCLTAFCYTLYRL
jgi:4-amino-4-deoxy-L-arabinose transferase-like glycosyltransferase